MSADKLTPEQRLQVAIYDAIAEAYKEGKHEGRSEMYAVLVPIINAPDEKSRDDAIARAGEEIKKWVV